jgi:CRP-like cAMP-binding protein
MLDQANKLHQFKLRIRDLIREESHWSHPIKVSARSCVYVAGEQDEMVYSIESGRIKLVLTTPEGREYVMAICPEGDLFGELCLSGELTRRETAVAIQDTRLIAIPYLELLKILQGKSLLEELIQYLVRCIARQQEVLGSLLSANSEQRLAKVLLQLGVIVGAECYCGTTVVPRILYEDLAAMVGTTRSRVGYFLKHFRELGLIEVNEDRSLTIETDKLDAFAANSLFLAEEKAEVYRNEWRRRDSSFLQLKELKK